MFKSKPKKPPQAQRIYHFVFIEVPINIVAPQAVLWGESSWWPKNSPLIFVRDTEGELAVGTRYRQRIKGMLGFQCMVEITRLEPNRLLEYTFRSGMVKGVETIKVEERANGTRVEYELYYDVTGGLRQILWKFFYQKAYHKSVQSVLDALRDYTVEVYHLQEKRNLEGK